MSAVHPRACGEHIAPQRCIGRRRPVHPRACGEHYGDSRCAGPGVPVHPRACGEHIEHAMRMHPGHRFIPARAGNTPPYSDTGRAYGGSSPRVRGTRCIRDCRPDRRSVHPRACGEHAEPRAPRVGRRRFIPARAGNTPTRAAMTRVRVGSSPRVRGTRACAPTVDGMQRRFIPARAGNTSAFGSRRSSVGGSSPRVRGTRRTAVTARLDCTVHPRACGEHRRAGT